MSPPCPPLPPAPPPSSPVPQAITESTAPYRCLSVSPGWQQLTGYTRDEALGSSLSILQGPLTEKDSLHSLMRAVHMQMPASVRLTNYTKDGTPYVHQLSVEPLRDPSGETRCFQATSLVLQAPGEPPSDKDPALLLGVPAVGAPPLWPLLGRAMCPVDAIATAHAHPHSASSASDASRNNLPTAVPTPLPSALSSALLSRGLLKAPPRGPLSQVLGYAGAPQEPGCHFGHGLGDMGEQLLAHQQQQAQRANESSLTRRVDELDTRIDQDLFDWLQNESVEDSEEFTEAMMCAA